MSLLLVFRLKADLAYSYQDESSFSMFFLFLPTTKNKIKKYRTFIKILNLRVMID